MMQRQQQPWNFQPITRRRSSKQPRQRGPARTWQACVNTIVCLLVLQLIGVAFVSLKLEVYLSRVSDNLTFLREELWQYTLLHHAVTANREAAGDDVVALEAAAVAGQEDAEQEEEDEEQEKEDEDRVAVNGVALLSNDTTALDDFYSRRHFDTDHPAPFLIVGGSDGSGTRAVVKTLLQLGVNFIIEDKGTMDVHGQEMFRRQGWPALVNLIMEQTHSGSYDFSSLPERLVKLAMLELGKFQKGLERRGRRKYHGVTRFGSPRTLTPKEERPALGVHAAWKAPVSMLLLPLLKEVFGQVKFLHVVRDGRDVSLSDNQSPVKKFYNTYYNLTGGNEENRTKDEVTIAAMRLWNDWNLQVMNWGKEHSDGETFDYHIVRSEDLMDPSRKFASLLQLADFVGANRTLAELCCLSQQTIVDLGKSDGTMGKRKRLKRDPNHPGLADLLLGRERRSVYARAAAEESQAGEFFSKLAEQVGAGETSAEYFQQQAKQFQEHREHQLGLHRTHAQLRNPYVQRLHQQHGSLMEHFHDQVNEEGVGEARGEVEETIQDPFEDPRRRLLTADELMAAAKARQSRMGQRHKGLGMHRKRATEAPDKVMARYGKWVKLLENQTDLSAQLHQLGSEGLEAFGYEPRVPFMDIVSPDNLQHCQNIIRKKRCRFESAH